MENNNTFIAKVFKILMITLLAVLIGFIVFHAVRIRVLSNHAFRDAKNVYMALSATEIEYYSRGESIYDPGTYSGLAPGVSERVKKLADNEGEYRIISYDGEKHMITGMLYINGNIYVMYDHSDNKSIWEVKYLMPIFEFKDEQVSADI